MEIVFEPHSDTTTKSPRPYTTTYTYTFQIALKPRAREGRKHASKKAPHGKQVFYQRNYITRHHPYDMHIYSSSSRGFKSNPETSPTPTRTSNRSSYKSRANSIQDKYRISAEQRNIRLRRRTKRTRLHQARK